MAQPAGGRVPVSVKGFLEKRLKLRVNLEKSAVDRPWHRVLLGSRLSVENFVDESVTRR
jgi:hypothetical protein